MANEQKQGQVKLLEARLTTLHGKSFSIMNQIVDIVFKEDIDQHFINGTISITEGFNLIEAFPLTGDELIVLEYETPYRDKNKSDNDRRRLEFKVVEIRDISKPSDKLTSYNLTIVSIEHTFAMIRGPARAHRKKISDIVADIVSYHVSSPKTLFVEETDSIQEILFPALSVHECLRLLCKRARSISHPDHDYRFFENKNGLNFVSMGELVQNNVDQAKNISLDISYNMSARFADEKTNRATDAALSFNVITKGNHNTTTYNGGFRANQIAFDTMLKKYKVKEFDYGDDSDFKKMPLLGPNRVVHDRYIDYVNTDIPETFSFFTNLERNNNPWAGGREEHYSNHYDKTLLPRNASKVHLQNDLVVNITIPGTNRVTAGDIIRFTVPDLNDQNPGREDKYLSGLYLVKSVQQAMNQERFISQLTVVKNGFERPLSTGSFKESNS